MPVRNYADMLWSMFNTQCKGDFDKQFCGNDKQLVDGLHVRSPELFHEVVEKDKRNDHDGEQPFYPPVSKPCTHAGGLFKEFLKYSFEKNGILSFVIVISIELLQENPSNEIGRILRRIHFPSSDIDGFLKGKFSSPSNWKELQKEYNASFYNPMKNETRVLLDQCWKPDCNMISVLSGYNYSACPDALAVIKNGGVSRITESAVSSFSYLRSVETEIDVTNKTLDVDYWDLSTQKGIIRGQSLRLMKVTYPGNKYHTCYAVKCTGKHCPVDEPCKGGVNVCGRGESSLINVCYPAIVITGMPKCGTSAMYDLLSRFPGRVYVFILEIDFLPPVLL